MAPADRLVTPGTRRSTLVVLALWTIAFGFLEGAIVVYLRALFYPDGFAFPLKEIPIPIYRVEVLREAATIVLLWGIAWTAASTGMRRFGAFAFCFGGWDLAYYATLKLVLDWPSSLLDWDILFLIPAPWTGPVLAPLMVSLGLIVAGGLVVLRGDATPAVRRSDVAVEVAAGLLVVAAFLWNVPMLVRGGSPASFPWPLFSAGVALGLGWFCGWWRRSATGRA